MYIIDIFYFIFFLKFALLMFRLKNILIILFAFEFLMVKILFAFIYRRTPFDPVTLLIFLAVAAREAAVGLALLVSILRQSGKDNLRVGSFLLREGF